MIYRYWIRFGLFKGFDDISAILPATLAIFTFLEMGEAHQKYENEWNDIPPFYLSTLGLKWCSYVFYELNMWGYNRNTRYEQQLIFKMKMIAP